MVTDTVHWLILVFVLVNIALSAIILIRRP